MRLRVFMESAAVIQPKMMWQPNRLVIAVVGTLASIVVIAALIFMFARRPQPTARIMPIELRLTSAVSSGPAASKQKPVSERRITPQVILKPLQIKKVENIPLNTIEPPSPSPVDWQQQIEMSVKSQGQSSSNSTGIILTKPSSITPLQQALNAPRKPETMQNGGSYRSIYGGVILKSGGICSELQTIQIGPSPSNRVTIAFPGHHCAGDYQPSMADELSKWVDQEAKRHPPP
ncbi:MAG: hypothetical protein WBR29_09080 [Gammaproteobacteria bacterium]